MDTIGWQRAGLQNPRLTPPVYGQLDLRNLDGSYLFKDRSEGTGLSQVENTEINIAQVSVRCPQSSINNI